MEQTIEFLKQQAALPEGAEAVTDLPEDVKAELGVGAGVFFKLLPLILEMMKNEQLRELVRKILDTLKPQQ